MNTQGWQAEIRVATDGRKKKKNSQTVKHMVAVRGERERGGAGAELGPAKLQMFTCAAT